MNQIKKLLIDLGFETRLKDGKELEEPIETIGGVEQYAETYQQAQRVVRLPKMTEFIGKIWNEDSDLFKENVKGYMHFITQPPTKENLEDCIVVMEGMSIDHQSEPALYLHLYYKTIEDALNDKVKIYIKID